MASKKPDNHREKVLRKVCAAVGHDFKDLTLLNRALTHSSLGNQGMPNYERLEFLGDAVLGFLIADALYKQKPEIPEGELTSRRSLMVSRTPLAEVAEDLELGKYLQVGRGLTHDSMTSPRILADLVEAVLGAIYLDGGVTAARRFVRDFVLERFVPIQEQQRHITDAKTRLNQWAQSQGLSSPSYKVVDVSGPDHDPTFKVAVKIDDVRSESSPVKNKQTGEQEAAAKAFARIKAREPMDSDPGDEDIQVVWDED